MEAEGVNTRVELAAAAAELRDRINDAHMLAGVTIVDPHSTWIDDGVVLSADGGHPTLHGHSKASRIAAGAEVGPHAVLHDAIVGEGALVGRSVTFAPARFSRQAKAGTFVEIKNSLIGEQTKVPHLSYIGDADIGANTNIAAGNITVNQDHATRAKERTVIGATSGPGSTMRSSPQSRSATTHGLQPAPSSQRMSPRARSPSPGPNRSTRRGGVESGTIEQTLPGLEAEMPRVEMNAGHAIPLLLRSG